MSCRNGKCQKNGDICCTRCNYTVLYRNETKAMYCSKKCQEEYWESYKDACDVRNKRRAIYRAGKILQTLHYIFRAKVFDENILYVVIEEQTIDVCAVPSIPELHYLDRIQTYPAIWCDNERQRCSFLALLKCRTSIVYLKEVIGYVLHGMDVSISELCVEPKNRRLKMYCVSVVGVRNSTEYLHHVLKVEVVGGEELILDLTCAQYGYTRPVINYNEYIDTRTKHVRPPQSFGTVEQEFRDETKDRLPESTMRPANYFFSSFLKGYVVEWETQEQLLVRDLLKLPQNDFLPKARELLLFVKTRLMEKIRNIKANPTKFEWNK